MNVLLWRDGAADFGLEAKPAGERIRPARQRLATSDGAV